MAAKTYILSYKDCYVYMLTKKSKRWIGTDTTNVHIEEKEKEDYLKCESDIRKSIKTFPITLLYPLFVVTIAKPVCLIAIKRLYISIYNYLLTTFISQENTIWLRLEFINFLLLCLMKIFLNFSEYGFVTIPREKCRRPSSEKCKIVFISTVPRSFVLPSSQDPSSWCQTTKLAHQWNRRIETCWFR